MKTGKYQDRWRPQLRSGLRSFIISENSRPTQDRSFEHGLGKNIFSLQPDLYLVLNETLMKTDHAIKKKCNHKHYKPHIAASKNLRTLKQTIPLRLLLVQL